MKWLMTRVDPWWQEHCRLGGNIIQWAAGIGIVLENGYITKKTRTILRDCRSRNSKAQLRLKALKFNKNTFTAALDSYLSKHPEWSREGRSLVRQTTERVEAGAVQATAA
jgi:hypothetical protein